MKPCRNGEFGRSLAAEIIGNNEDLLTEILFHVPAKSLVRFKSVSKRWLSLISDSRFSMNHTRKNPNPPISGILLAYYYDNKCEAISLQNQKSLPNLKFIGGINSDVQVRVCGVCNGLNLCSTECNSLFVCNPTTQKYIKLPKLVESVSSSYYLLRQTANLAFDPLESPHYKVLLTQCYIDCELGGDYYEVYIYSSESNSWENMGIDRCHGEFFWEKNKVSWNRAFHWIYEDKTHFRFDLKNKKLTETPNPLGPQDLRNIQIVYNGNCGGRYFLLQANKENLLTCDVLEMKKDDYSWNLKHTVDFSLLKCVVLKSNIYSTLNNLVSVLSVSEGSGKDDLELVTLRDDRVIRYNLNSNNTEVLQHLPGSFDGLFQYMVFKFQLIESLSPVLSM